MTNPAQAVLGVFAKQPIPGQVKTRLAGETSPEWAASVAEAFLRDTLARLAGIPARHVLAYAPANAGAYFAPLAGETFSLIPQAPGDLGQRMAAFFQAQQAAGARAAVLVGTDSPTLPLEWIARAFADLHGRADIVLGPATDGGYYLIGIGRRLPPIFEGVRWSSSHVLAETMARLPGDWRLELLPPWYDVDTLADWHMLRGHLVAMRRAGMDAALPHTAGVGDYSSLGDQ
jgi:hypothetical protein